MPDASTPKKLKIALAMGGGVSLGSFSGAALTEALKQLLLYGRDSKGNKYEGVVLDAMSGASAGSISLAIMMKCLLQPRRYANMKEVQSALGALYGKKIGEKKAEEISWNDIENLYKDHTELTDSKLQALVALDITQALQYAIWVDELDLDKLLGDRQDKNDDSPFGLLSRQHLLDVASRYLVDHSEELGDHQQEHSILADRLLMAFSMANLTPGAYSDYGTGQSAKRGGSVMPPQGMPSPPSTPALVSLFADATRVGNHNDLRVFDVRRTITNKPSDYDQKYITLVSGGEKQLAQCAGKAFEIDDPKAWATVGASAMASGAFPIAFEPVILKRYAAERSTEQLPARGAVGSSTETHDQGEYVAYADGGTFNNEPLKEAFKLAYSLDHDVVYEANADVDRLVLFVDPAIPQSNKPNQLSSMDPIAGPDGTKYLAKNESGKMLSLVGDLATMILGQSRINEEAKVKKFYHQSRLKDQMVSYLESVIPPNLESLSTSGLINTFQKVVNDSLWERTISLGTREFYDLVSKKYQQLCKVELGIGKSKCLTPSSIEYIVEALTAGQAIDWHTYFEKEHYAATEIQIHKDLLARAVLTTITEFALNQEGKNAKAQRAGIFPINEEEDMIRYEALPGYEMAAFAGFIQKEARKASFLKGIVDARRCLARADFRVYQRNLSQSIDSIAESAVQSFIPAGIEGYIRPTNELLDCYEKLKVEYLDEVEKTIRRKTTKQLINRIKPLMAELKLVKFGPIDSIIQFLARRGLQSLFLNSRSLGNLIIRKPNVQVKLLLGNGATDVKIKLCDTKKFVKYKPIIVNGKGFIKFFVGLDPVDPKIYITPFKHIDGVGKSNQIVCQIKVNGAEISLSEIKKYFLPSANGDGHSTLRQQYFNHINPVLILTGTTIQLLEESVPATAVDDIMSFYRSRMPSRTGA